MRHELLAVLALFAVGTANADPVALERGQVWTFADAPVDSARIIIGDVEPFGLDGLTAVSISITGLPYTGSTGPVIHHLPFSEAALRPALLELESEGASLAPYYSDGYVTWKQAIEADGAGVYTAPPGEVIVMIIQTIGNAR